MTELTTNPVSVLITRPQPQADRLAVELRAVLPAAVQVVVSPLMRMKPLPVQLPKGPHVAVILTSETGAMAAAALRARLPGLVHCVGPRTAEVARDAGFSIGEVAPTAADLLPQLMRMQHGGRLLYLHGRDVSVQIDQVLDAAGCPADAAAVYAQTPIGLSAAALQVLNAKGAVLVPLYSARSARLFFADRPDSMQADLWSCLIAQGVVEAVPAALRARAVVADGPDGAAMTTAIKRVVASLLP